MYLLLLTIHSFFRWLVIISLFYSILRGFIGWFGNKVFSKSDNFLRHSTATIMHFQFIIGYFLYSNSPITKAFLANFKTEIHNNSELRFFGIIHVSLMMIAIITVTLGSSIAKRKETDQEKFKTIAIWFTVVLLIIFIAIPWPFSPLASRPYLRTF